VLHQWLRNERTEDLLAGIQQGSTTLRLRLGMRLSDCLYGWNPRGNRCIKFRCVQYIYTGINNLKQMIG
jgi:hypothetical protein